jgi:hypothetical protein
MAAEDGQAGDDMVTRLNVAYLRADGLDHTSRLVSKHDRHGGGIQSFVKMHVAMTDTGRHCTHEDFVRPRGTDGDILNGEGFMDFAEYGSFHGDSPLYMTA